MEGGNFCLINAVFFSEIALQSLVKMNHCFFNTHKANESCGVF